MKKLLLRLLPYLKPHRTKFLQACCAMICVAILQSGSALILKSIFDNVFILKQSGMLGFAVIAVPSFFFLKMTAGFAQAYLMSWIGQKTIQDIRDTLFAHLHDLSVEFYWRKRSGEIMSRVTNDLNSVQSMLQFLPLYLIRDTLTLFSLICVLFYIHWKFAILSFLAAPLAAAVLLVLGKKMRRAGKQSQSITGEIYHRFQESLQGMTIVKAFNYESGSIARFREKNEELFVQMMKYLRATAMSGPLMEFAGSLVFTLMIFYGGREVIALRMTPGSFVAFLTAFLMAYSPLKNIAHANSTLQMGLASWERILQLLDEKPAVMTAADPIPIPHLKGLIKFENVTYRYPGTEKDALRDLNITINPGEAVAFVGPSGSGKTTIVHLLLRLFDPLEGIIRYDGHDLRQLDLKQLRSNIGLVSQDTVLFDDTVSANISLGVPNPSEEDITNAAKTADAHSFISGLPQAYSTVLGERGVKLSGGQRQRLAIARSVFKKPSVLILDEATSNLDTGSEKSVQEAIEKALKDRTVIMVAHRLSTIQNADRIFVLDSGRITESGNHRELISNNGIYRKLYEMQASSAEQ